MISRILLLFSIVILCGCSAPRALEYRDYKDFHLESLGFSVSRVSLGLEYFNPNNFGLQLRKTDLDIFINDNLLGHSSSDTLINIPRNNTFVLPIKFDVDMKNLLKNAWNSVIQNEVTIKVTGRLKIGKANVFMSMPVNYEGKQKIPLF